MSDETTPAPVAEDIAPREPARARAVLSTEDFKLIREAVLFYLKEIQDKPESVKFSNLYHRLGSAAGR